MPHARTSVVVQTRKGWWATKLQHFAQNARMARSNRDLLVTFKADLMSQDAIEQEIAYLHELLTRVERIDNLIVAHELIDMNRYKITRKSLPLRMHIRSRQQPPFVFLSCLN